MDFRKKSVTLIIERKLAEEYDLIDPQYVVLERAENGILIRKLVTENKQLTI